MKITNEIFQVGGGEYSRSEDAAVYLIMFGNHAAVVDAGCGQSVDLIMENIRACGVTPETGVEYLLLTHCHYDHTGGAAELRERLGCKIVAHKADARFLESGDSSVTAASWYGTVMEPFAVDVKLSGSGDTVHLGSRKVEAIHIPGHSPGSLAYLTESESKKVLFGQDIHGPLAPILLSNAVDYKKSLERLIALEADILCEGHFGVYHGKKKVKAFIRSYLDGV